MAYLSHITYTMLSTPRLYQKHAVDNILEHIRGDPDNASVGTIHMFCGSGKSKVMADSITILNYKRSLVVVPSLALMDQYVDSYITNKAPDCCMRVCSSADDIEDAAAETTNPDDITAFLNKNAPQTQTQIICCTYKSLPTLMDNLGGADIGFACFDEGHRAMAANSRAAIFQHQNAAMIQHKLFFTATPKNKRVSAF